jgi:hypothetical protein
MLIVIITLLVVGYFWATNRYSSQREVGDSLEFYKIQVSESETGYIDLRGKLVREGYYFYLEKNGEVVPVISQQLNLNSFIDKLVEVRLKLNEDRLEIIKIEEK